MRRSVVLRSNGALAVTLEVECDDRCALLSRERFASTILAEPHPDPEGIHRGRNHRCFRLQEGCEVLDVRAACSMHQVEGGTLP